VLYKPELYPREFHKANDFCCRSAFDITIVKSIKHSDLIEEYYGFDELQFLQWEVP